MAGRRPIAHAGTPRFDPVAASSTLLEAETSPISFSQGAAIVLGPWLLARVSPDKAMLPRPLLVLLALNAFGELNFAFWTTLISTENRIPAFRAFTATQLAGVIAASSFVLFGGGGLEVLVVVPLLLGSATQLLVVGSRRSPHARHYADRISVLVDSVPLPWKPQPNTRPGLTRRAP